MHSVMCMRHMGKPGYKDGTANQMSIVGEDTNDVAYTEIAVESANSEPIVIEAEQLEPDGFAEDGTPIYNIN